MLDGAHSAALDQPVIRPFRLALVDFADEPLRITEAPYALSVSSTGDDDLDGYTFTPIQQVIHVSDVTQNETGADAVTFTLSALIGDPGDNEIMNTVGDLSKWQGRLVRLWRWLFTDSLTPIGYPDPYFTGYLSKPTFRFTPEGSIIQITAESYLAMIAGASNRSYLSQSDYDPGDLSAEAAIAIANGIEGNALGPGLPTLDDFMRGGFNYLSSWRNG